MKHLRALFVLFHVLAVFVMAFPAPVGAMNKALWGTPDMQATFQSYTETLNGMGVAITQDEFEAWLWDAGTALMDVRSAALKPVQPYLEATGSRQGWRMFGTLNLRPAVLVIDVAQDRQGPWTRIYEMRSDEHDWRREQLDQERVRGFLNSYAWLSRKGSYEQFSVWAARHVAQDLPDPTHMRIAMERRRIPDPQTMKASGWPEPSVHWQTVYSLDKYRLDKNRPEQGR